VAGRIFWYAANTPQGISPAPRNANTPQKLCLDFHAIDARRPRVQPGKRPWNSLCSSPSFHGRGPDARKNAEFSWRSRSSLLA